MDIILASQSPRRRELLERMGLPFRVITPDIDERMERALPPGELVAAISAEKAGAVAAQAGPDAVVIAADTVVALDGAVLGKPADESDAARMLSALSGRTHQVFTGLTVACGADVRTVSEETAVTFRPLTAEEIEGLCRRAVTDERGFGMQKVEVADEAYAMIARFANGDARTALGTLEMAVLNGRREGDKTVVDTALVEQCTQKKSLLYDKNGEEHYNLISALHKSMRNSDPDAAVYWLARMLEAGEDPLYVARRLIRFATEDIGLADSRALDLCVAAYQACHFLGMPECNIHLAHAVIYLSLAPRSNAVYVAYERAKRDALSMLDEPVPLHLRNAPTKLMKELDYGKGYVYAHDTADGVAAMDCLPPSLAGKRYYEPTERGNEARAKQRLDAVLAWKQEHKKEK